MEHPGRDPLRGKFTRFLQESIKHFKIDYFRKSEHRPISLEALWQVQADHQRERPCAQGFDFQWEALGEAYRSLPRSYQEVLFLLLVKELTPQEAANQLHCPVEQVYVRKSRAIKLLRKKLGGIPAPLAVEEAAAALRFAWDLSKAVLWPAARWKRVRDRT